MDIYNTLRPSTRSQNVRAIGLTRRKLRALLQRPFTQSNKSKDNIVQDTTISGSRNFSYSKHLSFTPFLAIKNKLGLMDKPINREVKCITSTRKHTETNTILLIKSMTKKRRTECRKLIKDTMTIRSREFPLRITKLNSYETKPKLKRKRCANYETLGNSVNNENIAVYFEKKSLDKQRMKTIKVKSDEYFDNNILNQIYKH